MMNYDVNKLRKSVSVSGGKSSAYIAANYKADYLTFALVTIEDRRCTPKDKKLVQIVSDKIGREFIATAEDDTILHTMLDLEQYLGQEIIWLTGPTFDELTKKGKESGKYLPSKLRRYCTVEMKLEPMFKWFRNECTIPDGEPIITAIGFRSGEERRAQNMRERCDENGVLWQKEIVGKTKNGRNKWKAVPWQIPVFPMIEDGIKRDRVHEFWKGKPVRFADRNNCVGCFHRNPLLLRLMFDQHPEKMQWFAEQEMGRKNPKDNFLAPEPKRYADIAKHKTQLTLMDLEGFSECDSGYCGL